MPGYLLTAGSVVCCAHGGIAQAAASDARLRIGGLPAVTLATHYAVAGCALPPQAGGPCVAAQWLSGAARVTSRGLPVLLAGGASVCVPTGTPLTVVSTQARVRGV
jgi:uncharacterized Zn-binding protein involved in type VI secretion